MGTWTNDDGLYIKYGTTEGDVTKGGQVSTMDTFQVVEVEVDLTTLGTDSSILADNVVIPAGATVNKVETLCRTAADSAGDAATLNIGLIRTDRTTTYDADGLVAAAVQGTMDLAGELTEHLDGGTYAGALLGTVLANDGLLVADYDTAAFTAGVIVIRVTYSVI